ncbi:MAG: 2OG-Fe(II) oxygenase [Nanoarchaeota archaeon]|mgnify:CR=1 FL=1
MIKVNWLRWVSGRQGGDYQKKLLAILKIPFVFGFDMYLLKFAPGFVLPEHVDQVKRGRHFRMNIILKGNGEFKCERAIIRTKRVILFRPDKYKHSMHNGNAERKVLSIGINI